jgi:hypothetical protein
MSKINLYKDLFKKNEGEIMYSLVFLFILLSFYMAKSRADLNASASKVSPNLVKKAVAENYFPIGSQKQINPKVLVLKGQKDFYPSGGERKKLYVFNFDTLDLCGVAGCLYVVYSSNGQKLLSLYLHQQENIDLFAVDESQKDFSCLKVTQHALPKGLIETRYCYQGEGLIPVFQQIKER